ncbi:hypothetical protein GCM10027416_24840 [Okibacterium endophyticum]
MLILAVAGSSQTAALALSSSCDEYEASLGLCPGGSIGNGEVVIGGDQEHGGGGDHGVHDPGSGPVETDGNGDGIDDSDQLITCGGGAACIADAITISDLARFSPVQASLSMEPEGWMIVGLPANFFVSAGIHSVDGSLFEHPVSVRFTPTAFHWNWGDGASSTTSTGGASWQALGLPEFAPTQTSHVYAASGSYTISATVSYSVDFSIAGLPWRSVSGSLDGPASVAAAVAGTAKSVLVDRECTRNPEGPGC